MNFIHPRISLALFLAVLAPDAVAAEKAVWEGKTVKRNDPIPR